MAIKDMTKRDIKLLVVAEEYSPMMMKQVKHFYHRVDGTVEDAVTTLYKERAARSFAEAILKNWDTLVDGPHMRDGEDGGKVVVSYLNIQSLEVE